MDYLLTEEQLMIQELARQIAQNAPRGETLNYPVAHFEFYRPDVRSIVLKDQINFLRKHMMHDLTLSNPPLH